MLQNRLLFILLPILFFGQNSKKSEPIKVTSYTKQSEISKQFHYFIDKKKEFSTENFSENKPWKPYNSKYFKKQYKNRTENFILWLRADVKNTSKDTLNLVISLD